MNRGLDSLEAIRIMLGNPLKAYSVALTLILASSSAANGEGAPQSAEAQQAALRLAARDVLETYASDILACFHPSQDFLAAEPSYVELSNDRAICHGRIVMQGFFGPILHGC